MGVHVSNHWWRTRGAGKLDVSPAFYVHPLLRHLGVTAITHVYSNSPHSDATTHFYFLTE